MDMGEWTEGKGEHTHKAGLHPEGSARTSKNNRSPGKGAQNLDSKIQTAAGDLIGSLLPLELWGEWSGELRVDMQERGEC